MKYFITLCSCLWLYQTLVSGAAVKKNPNLSIVGGVSTNITSFPWQVQIVKAIDGQHLCGGSIISKTFILSAAHCFGDNGKDDTNLIRAGITDIMSGGGFESEIDTVTIHPFYNINATNDFDIALIKLTTPIPAFNKYMQAILLPDQNEKVKDGVRCNVSGWGDTVENQQEDFPTILQMVSLPMVNQQVCNTSVTGITNSMICAGFVAGGKDSCQGDSGGPLVCLSNGKVKQFGVVSWGNGCAQAGQYGVYSKVSAFGIRDWIKSFSGV